jgi:hypothetical protein
MTNPKIPDSPLKVVQEMKTFLTDQEVDALNHPDPIIYSKNIKIAYPGFLFWLKFTDEIRNHGDLREKVGRYRHNKPRYEDAIAHRLYEYPKFLTGQAVMNGISRAKHSIFIGPADWDKAALEGVTLGDDTAAETPQGELARDLDGKPVSPHIRGTGQGTNGRIKLSPENMVPLNTQTTFPAFRSTYFLFHEIVHAMFTLDGKLGKLPVNLYHRNEAEFDAILVTNIYMSENGERNLLASHDPPGNPALQNPDKFLDNKALIPKARFLLNRFRLFEPIVFRDLADIPVTRANFNPVRQYRDELNRQMKTPKKPQKP